MEDISSVVGEVVVSVADKDYLLDNFGFDDYSAFKSQAIVRRKRDILLAVDSLKGIVTQSEYEGWRRDALDRASEIKDLGEHEIKTIMTSTEGASLLLWCMLERRYPQRVKYAQVLKCIEDEQITGEQYLGAMGAMFAAMGSLGEDSGEGNDGDQKKGNEEGQPGTAVATE